MKDIVKELDKNIFTPMDKLRGDEVFEYWRFNEINEPHWIEYWKSKGFKSWEEWRTKYAQEFKLRDREWVFCRILDPINNIPFFRGGPLSSWVKNFYHGLPAPTFDWIVRENIIIESNDAVVSMAHNFPSRSVLTGLYTRDGVMIIEGMHRCCAVASIRRQGRELTDEVYICLALAYDEELPTTGGVMADQ